MSVTVFLQVRHNEMTDDLLEDRGHLHEDGLKSLKNQDGSLQEMTDLVMDSPSYEIGVSPNEDSLTDELKGGKWKTPTKVTDEVVNEIKALAEDYERDDTDQLVNWLEQNKGEEIFSRVE